MGNAIRFKLTIVAIGDRLPIEGKPYPKLIFTAKSDKTGDNILEYVVFSTRFMDMLAKGKTIDADVEIDKEKGQNVVVNIATPKPNGTASATSQHPTYEQNREASFHAQATLDAVSVMLASGNVKVPAKIKKNHFALIEKWQDEGLNGR